MALGDDVVGEVNSFLKNVFRKIFRNICTEKQTKTRNILLNAVFQKRGIRPTYLVRSVGQ